MSFSRSEKMNVLRIEQKTFRGKSSLLFGIENSNKVLQYKIKRENKFSVALICADTNCTYTLNLTKGQIESIDTTPKEELLKVESWGNLTHQCKAKPCLHTHTCKPVKPPSNVNEILPHQIILLKKNGKEFSVNSDQTMRPQGVKVKMNNYVFDPIEINPKKWQFERSIVRKGRPLGTNSSSQTDKLSSTFLFHNKYIWLELRLDGFIYNIDVLATLQKQLYFTTTSVEDTLKDDSTLDPSQSLFSRSQENSQEKSCFIQLVTKLSQCPDAPPDDIKMEFFSQLPSQNC